MKTFLALALVALVSSADAQVADYSTKMLNAVNAKRAEKGLAANLTVTAAAELVGAGYTSVDSMVASWLKASSDYIYADYPFIGPGYKYDKTKQYKHYWVLDLSDGEGETCA
ncbi:hypothetical protein PI124_g18546 [Phytophthora idaei]|nr:hypothetical protein PI125_g24231 [Phytophthora idaei]KAG3236450.1 hypothetical protein PI124_g18546 [Phytophthora idaei]